ncbi:MAG: hypothetical protein M0P13_12630, partial [Fibrobacteraceae bacterium]|nr:hypothetical protein [Fibrobacteraceae bacterium]
FAEAMDLLSKVSLEGDEEDKSKAFLLLGKIQEISESPQNATFYYKQALTSPRYNKEAYFLASRIAALDSKQERIVHATVKLPAPIQKTFQGKTPVILLTNNQQFRPQGDKFISVPTFLPDDAKIYSVSSSGTWFSIQDETILRFQPAQAQKPSRNYSFDSPILSVLPIPGNGALIMTEKDFIFATNEGIRFSIENRYQGCTPLGIYAPQNKFVLNCPDNALHLLQTDNGTESQVLSQIDPINKVLLSNEGIFLSSANNSWYYKPQRKPIPVWKNSGNPIEDAAFFGNDIAVLESAGKLKLLTPETGDLVAETRTDGEYLYELSKGVLGVFSQEGTLTALDTLLRPIWKYQFGKHLVAEPIKSQGTIYLPFENGELVSITALHYGMRPILSQQFAFRALADVNDGNWEEARPLIDSTMKLEQGNASANYLFALDKEHQNASEREKALAWSNAVRYSFGDSKAAPSILAHYAKIIEAKYVHFLQMSPRTLYPSLFNSGHTLFTIDPAAQTLLAINPDNGETKWTKGLGILESSPVMANDENSLAIASGFRLNILDLSKDGKIKTEELPGKPFQIQFTDKALFISTWNGYFIKFLKPNFKLAWSRKLYNLPFHFDFSKDDIAVTSLEGEAGLVSNISGQTFAKLQSLGANTVALQTTDSLIAIATDENEIHIYSKKGLEEQSTIKTDASILSMQWITLGTTQYLLLGLSNQNISLYLPSTQAPIWTFKGRNSIYTTPLVKGAYAWIDQGTSIVKIALSKGSIEKRYNTPGGAGTPFILDNVLFCTSPKRLLYAFPLQK